MFLELVPKSVTSIACIEDAPLKVDLKGKPKGSKWGGCPSKKNGCVMFVFWLRHLENPQLHGEGLCQ